MDIKVRLGEVKGTKKTHLLKGGSDIRFSFAIVNIIVGMFHYFPLHSSDTMAPATAPSTALAHDYTNVKIHLLKSGMIYDKVTILLLVIILLLTGIVILIKCQ